MITRINSSKAAKLKLLLIVPFTIFLLFAFTIETATEKVFNQVQLQSTNKSTKIPFIFPVKRVTGVEISASFGKMIDPFTKQEREHKGVDIKAPLGTPIYATADGLVRKVKMNHVEGKSYGRYIIVDHKDGFSTLYSMLSKYKVKEGQEVNQGDIIGYIGSSGRSTGPHLHYEVMKDGENLNPEDYF